MADQNKGGVNPVAAAVVGAGVAVVAGAVALADKDNRKKVDEVMTKVGDVVEEKKEEVRTVIADGSEAVKEVVDEMSNAVKGK